MESGVHTVTFTATLPQANYDVDELMIIVYPLLFSTW